MRKTQVKKLLDELYDKFNKPEFIEEDPISIPHLFTKKRDIEIAGFFAATLAWGQRKTIINKCQELMQLMDMAPHDFCLNHDEKDLKNLIHFKHRTFNATDLLYTVEFLQNVYTEYDSLEEIFSFGTTNDTGAIENGLNHFSEKFTALPHFPARTGKHVASPAKKSACKRLNMYLRWMVRQDDRGVDFGLWKNINPSQLVCPLDVHVERIARKLGLLKRKQTDWMAALELTENLRKYDPEDPVKYDFALFGLGVQEKNLLFDYFPQSAGS